MVRVVEGSSLKLRGGGTLAESSSDRCFNFALFLDRVGSVTRSTSSPTDLGFPACAYKYMAPTKRDGGEKLDKPEWRFSSSAEISHMLKSQDEQGLLRGAVRHGFSDLWLPYSPMRR